ncbi:MAG TPA: ABC transporter permease [Caldilineae bacterium]|nr:ABC transporter permease [Caldilineae bacterium]
MHKVWIIARHEYAVNVRRLGFILMTVLVPLLGAMGLLVAAFFGGEATQFFEEHFAMEPKNVGLVDHLGNFTPILPKYQDRFRLFADEESGRAAMMAGEITTLLVIPEDYIATGRVIVYSKGSSFSAAVLEESSLVRAFFVDHLLRDRVDPLLRERLAVPIRPVVVSLAAEGRPQEGPLSTALNIIVPYILGILLIMTIFVSSGYLLRGVAEEKGDRIIEILLSSVTAWELMAGKVIGLGALGLTQVLIWLGAALGLGGGAVGLLGVAVTLLSRPEVFVLGLIYYLLGFLVYAVSMGAVGALGSTMHESQQLAGIFSLAAAIPLMLSGFLFSDPNMPLARVLSWFPLTAPTMMLIRLPMTEVPLIDIVGSIVMLILSIPAILWAGSKVFRMGLLMYGKRPTLTQVIRALREA